MKWDLILESDGSNLFVSDFKITPISKEIPFNIADSYPLLNYPHQYNIKKFYEKTRGYFYTSNLIPQFNHNWPIVGDQKKLDSHDGSFEMGGSRGRRNEHTKQFEFFVPVWIEDLSQPISFTINIYNNRRTTSSLPMSSRTLTLEPFGDAYTFHNRFVKYFSEYIDYIGLNSSNNRFGDSLTGSDVININLRDQKSKVVGVNVETGNVVSKDNNHLPVNLLYRERPLMEADDMICRSFKDNSLIIRQLFNFNLCFNVEDLMTSYISKQLVGEDLYFEVLVGVGGNPVELRDFWYNYEFIEKECTHSSDIKQNVLDYMSDHKCIDLISSNKFSPSIVHWSLEDNNDYIFNVYNGFGGFYIDVDGKTRNIYRRYGSFPNLINSNYTAAQNNIGWCNHWEGLMNMEDLSEFINNTISYVDRFSEIGGPWMNGVKYEFNQSLRKGDKKTSVFASTFDNEAWRVLFTMYSQYLKNENLFIIPIADLSNEVLLFVAGRTYNDITYKNVKDVLSSLDPKSLSINDSNLLNYISSVIEPTTYKFNKGVYIDKAPSPSVKSSEITYFKNDENESIYIDRYDGKIRPTFIDPSHDSRFNYLYTKKIYGKDDFKLDKPASIYSLYSSSGFEPLFPSIEYCSIESVRQNYEDYRGVVGEELLEVKWFNWSHYIELAPEINLTCRKSGDDRSKELDDLILDELAVIYKFEDRRDPRLKYIYGLYNTYSDFDYIDKKSHNDYIYTVKLTLK